MCISNLYQTSYRLVTYKLHQTSVKGYKIFIPLPSLIFPTMSVSPKPNSSTRPPPIKGKLNDLLFLPSHLMMYKCRELMKSIGEDLFHNVFNPCS